MNKRRALSLVAVFTYSTFVILGCSLQMAEDDHADVSEEHLGQAEQYLLQCGLNCPIGSHATQTSCDSILCSAYGSCNALYPNRVQCAQDSGTFDQCGLNCPNGWHATQTICSPSCNGFGSCNNGAHNQATCVPDCGTHDKMWIVENAESQLMYEGGWCSIGTNWPEMCWNGTYYYSQGINSQTPPVCFSPGSGGSCYNPDAWWRVTCDALVECIYDCSGTCVQATCQ